MPMALSMVLLRPFLQLFSSPGTDPVSSASVPPPEVGRHTDLTCKLRTLVRASSISLLFAGLKIRDGSAQLVGQPYSTPLTLADSFFPLPTCQADNVWLSFGIELLSDFCCVYIHDRPGSFPLPPEILTPCERMISFCRWGQCVSVPPFWFPGSPAYVRGRWLPCFLLHIFDALRFHRLLCVSFSRDHDLKATSLYSQLRGSILFFFLLSFFFRATLSLLFLHPLWLSRFPPRLLLSFPRTWSNRSSGLIVLVSFLQPYCFFVS